MNMITKNNKKCMIIMPALYAGGAEKQYRYIIHELSYESDNIIVLILNNSPTNARIDTDQFIEQHKNVEFFQLGGAAVDIKGKGYLRTILSKVVTLVKQYFWLKSYLKYEQVGVVMFSYMTQLLMMSLFNKHKVRVIFNERNTGRQICDKSYKIKLLKQCYKIIANSNYAANYIQERVGVNVDIYNNGIQYKKISHIKHDGINILVPARIVPIKNQMLIVEAASFLKHYPIKIILAGAYENTKYVQAIKESIRNGGLDNMFELPGYIDNMENMYEKTDLVILPSFEEGTPNILLEAYLYNIMVLASDIPMNADCCIDKELLFDPQNAHILAEKINSVINGNLSLKKNKILEKNNRYVIDNYSIKILREKYSALLL